MKNLLLLLFLASTQSLMGLSFFYPLLVSDAIVQVEMTSRDGLDVVGVIEKVVHGNRQLLVEGEEYRFAYGDYQGCGLDSHHEGFDHMLLFLNWTEDGYELAQFDTYFLEVRSNRFDLDICGYQYRLDATFLEKELPLIRKAYGVQYSRAVVRPDADIEQLKKSSWLLSQIESKGRGGCLNEYIEIEPADPEPVESEELPIERVYESYELNEQAVYDGGPDGYIRDVNKIVKYPEPAKEAGIEGNVYIRIIIRHDGTIDIDRIMRSPHPILEKEAVRCIEELEGGFTPGKVNGEAVDSFFIVPIRFVLNP